MSGISWEDLDDMVEDDPLKLRDRAWREIRTRDMELTELRKKLAAHVSSGAALINIARTLDSQAAISDRPGQMETLEGLASRLRKIAGWPS